MWGIVGKVCNYHMGNSRKSAVVMWGIVGKCVVVMWGKCVVVMLEF